MGVGTEGIEVPALLNVPPKMREMMRNWDGYRYFLIEGGRGSAKTQSIARWVLYLADVFEDLRVVCGREVMNTISESVHAVLKDLVRDYELAYDVLQNEIRHMESGCEIKFKGFREQGKTNIKGLEGVDVLWIDEAQAITRNTLNDLIPTIRKPNSKIIFSMNRFLRDDAVYQEFVGRDDCLHIKINYDDNPFCPAELKKEAERCKERNPAEYENIWLGEPYNSAEDYLFDSSKLRGAVGKVVEDIGVERHLVVGIDFAAQGNDMCVATVLQRIGHRHWGIREQIAWKGNDPTDSIGRIVNVLGSIKPDVAVLDVGGMGTVVYARLRELGVDIKRFDGATTQGVHNDYYNARAEGYWLTKIMFDDGLLCLTEKDYAVLNELEKIKMKHRSDGKRLMQPKSEMAKSPDRADSFMMAVWAMHKYLGSGAKIGLAKVGGSVVKRIDKPKRRFL